MSQNTTVRDRFPRPLPLPRFVIPLGFLAAVLSVAFFAAVACRGDRPADGAELSPTLGVVAPIGGASAGAQQEEDEEDLEEFVPTEEVSADKSVSFPVDI